MCTWTCFILSFLWLLVLFITCSEHPEDREHFLIDHEEGFDDPEDIYEESPEEREVYTQTYVQDHLQECYDARRSHD